MTKIKRSYSSIFFRLVVPTILFSTLIYIPKILFHSLDVSWSQYLFDVFGGVSYWFTSALIVSQVILNTLMLCRIRSLFFYFCVSVLLFGGALLLRNYDVGQFPWYYKSGMAVTFFMVLGGIYGKYEGRIDKTLGKVGTAVIIITYSLVTLLVMGKYDVRCAMLSVNVNALGFAVSLLGIAFVVCVSKMLPSIRLLNYIGKHSIVFYFLSGVIPAAFGAVVMHVSHSPSYWMILLVCILSLCVATVATLFIDRYLPFLLDVRNFKR